MVGVMGVKQKSNTKEYKAVFEKVKKDLKSEKFDEWEFRFGGVYSYFLDKAMYSFIDHKFSDTNGCIFLKKPIEIEDYSSLDGPPDYLPMICDRIIFDKKGNPNIADHDESISKNIEHLLEWHKITKRDFNNISSIKNSILRVITNDPYLELMEIMHPIWIDKNIPKRKIDEEMEKYENIKTPSKNTKAGQRNLLKKKIEKAAKKLFEKHPNMTIKEMIYKPEILTAINPNKSSFPRGSNPSDAEYKRHFGFKPRTIRGHITKALKS